jgi:hypothetical protein
MSTSNSSELGNQKYQAVIHEYASKISAEASKEQRKAFFEMMLITFSSDTQKYSTLKQKYRNFVG